MAISLNRYVDIISAVGAATQVANRDFIGRLFTTNPLLPTASLAEFDTADEVGDYFGTDSDEYARAQFYFDWISKNATAADKISFARWADEDAAPTIYGAVKTQALATYTAISNGSFGLTIGGVVNTFTALDFSGAASLAAVAAIIETAINAKTGTQWTAATVAYDATRGSFNFVGGDTVAAVISVQQGVGGTPIANTIGWLTGAILSDGALEESITDTLQNSWDASNNFGSFLFMPSLTLDQKEEAGEWTDGMDISVIYSTTTAIADAATYYNALKNYGGTGVTVSATSGEYPEQFPMMIFAATDYSKRNAVQNYMYQQSNLTPSVSSDSVADTLDANRINYYGNTQNAGQQVSFYQRGTLMGLATSPTDMGVFANEIWLKDSAGVAIMNLLLAVSQVPANKFGQSQILSVLQGVIEQAVNNGTISVGKTLTSQQKLYITQLTGDDNAWQQVQNIGYWLNCVIVPYQNGDVTEYKAVYTLIYSKNDVIRKVDGSHILI